MHADPYIFVPTRAQGRAACVNVHISLIITYRNLQAEINRRRNYLGRETEKGNREGEGTMAVVFGAVLKHRSVAGVSFSAPVQSPRDGLGGWGRKLSRSVLQDLATRGLCLHIGRRQRVHICWRVCRGGGGGPLTAILPYFPTPL